MEQAFIAYIDDDNQKKEGYFYLKEITLNYIIFITTDSNEITIPINRVLKIKKKVVFDE